MILANSANAITSGSGEANLTVSNNWGSGYCAEVTVSNNGSSNITSWTVELDLNGSTIGNLWNGNLSGNSVTPADHNATVAPNSSTNFGFCANGGSVAELAALSVEGGGSPDPDPTPDPGPDPTPDPNPDPDPEPNPDPDPEPNPDPNPTPPDFPDFFVGNITTNGSVRSDFIDYWDQITPENEGKWAQWEVLAIITTGVRWTKFTITLELMASL